MPKKLPAILTALVFAFPVVPTAVAYDRVCLNQTGVYSSKFYLRVMGEHPPNAELSRHHRDFKVTAGFRKCHGVGGVLEPGTLFSVNIDPEAGVDAACWIYQGKREAAGASPVHGSNTHLLRWAGHGDLAIQAWGTSVQSHCNVEGVAMWEGCAQGRDSFQQLGCRVFRPEVTVNAAYDYALRDWNIAYLDSVLDRGANVNIQPRNDETPLHVVVRMRKGEHFRRVMESNPNVNLQNAAGRTPLMAAVWEYRDEDGLLEIVRTLLAAGADPNIGGSDGNFPIHDAARNGQHEVVRALLEAGADPGQTDDRGQSALQLARDNNRDDAARALFAASVVDAIENRRTAQLIAAAETAAANDWADLNITHKRLTPLQHAIRGNMPEAVEPLLNGGADPNIPGDQVGFAAIHDGVKHSPDVVRKLLDGGANPNQPDRKGFTPLHWALDPTVELQSGTTAEIVAALLAAGADPNHVAGGETPLHLASGGPVGPRPNIVRMLLDANADPHILGAAPRRPEGYAPIHFAAAKSIEVTRMFAESGADFTLADANRETPLHWATALPQNRLANDIVEAILAAGGDPDAKGKNGDTAFFRAVKQDQAELAATLLNGGSDPLIPDHVGQTPLHHAARMGHADVVRALLEWGVEADRPNLSTRFTPLTEAVLNNHVETARILIEAGANINYATNDGYSLLGHAVGRQFPELVELLILNGADTEYRGPHGTNTQAAERIGGNIAHVFSQAAAAMGTNSDDAPLAVAVLHNRVDDAYRLLRDGADPNLRTPDGYYLIHHAAGRDFTGMIVLLMAYGADERNLRDANGESAADIVFVNRRRRNPTMAAMNEGATIRDSDDPKFAYAVMYNRVDEVRERLEDGADPDLRTADGYFMLVHAAGRRYPEVARLLVQHGALLDGGRDRHGKTIREYAAEFGGAEVNQAIREAEAERGTQ